MTRVLLLAAVDVEVRGLARHLGLSRVTGSPFPHFRGGALELLCVGLRAGALEARAPRCRPADIVVSAGACGALAPDLGPGQLVVPEMVADPDGRRWPTAPLPALPRRGTLISVPEVVESASAKARLFLESGALAVDMESALILAWAASRGVAGAVVRAVADVATRGVPADLAATVAADGRVQPLRAVAAALARPRAVADALALRSGTAAALRTVAAALARMARAE